MDNKNYNKSTDDIYAEGLEQRYSYEQERKNYQRASSGADARYRAQKQKRLVLLFVLGAVLILLWVIAAVAIVKAVFADVTPDEGEGADTTALSETDSTPETEGGGSVAELGFVAVSMEEGSHRTGELILVNAEHKYDQSADKTLSTSLVAVSDKSTKSYIVYGYDKLRRDVVSAMNEMFDAAYSEKGLDKYYFNEDYGYCTAADQDKWYKAQAEKVANPDRHEFKSGESEHETGYSFDLKTRIGGATKVIGNAPEEYKWIYDNCYKYGIIYRYPADKEEHTGVNMAPDSIHYDHFRYVGKAAAAVMHEKNWCLEEFVSAIANYTYDGEHLSVTGADGVSYEMYYFPAQQGAKTDVLVPEGAEYSISGNNIGGYIVTITIK